MTTHNYAILDEDGVIVNVVIVDDEAEGWDDARGKWEPHTHESAQAIGWLHLGPVGATPAAWIGDKVEGI